MSGWHNLLNVDSDELNQIFSCSDNVKNYFSLFI